MLIDRLYESVENRGPVCVGLDTSIDYIPEEFLNRYTSFEDALFNFNKRIIDATFDVSACFKVQIAYYEALGIKGLGAYKSTLKYIREKGSIVIADIKRGDIAATAAMYAKAHFCGDFESDFITLNPYMGLDTLEPYMEYVKTGEKGLFLLVRTSNKGAADIQYVENVQGQKVYDMVGNKINELGRKYIGKHGYSPIGGVIGCTHVDEALELRKNLDSTFFLIPGYGAQGGSAQDVVPYLKNRNGGIVNSSRGVLLSYKKQPGREMEFDLCAREEAMKIRDEISKAVGGKLNGPKLYRK